MEDEQRSEPGEIPGAGHTTAHTVAGREADWTPTRGDRLLHVVLLVWGALMLVIVLAGVVGFLVCFFLLQR